MIDTCKMVKCCPGIKVLFICLIITFSFRNVIFGASLSFIVLKQDISQYNEAYKGFLEGLKEKDQELRLKEIDIDNSDDLQKTIENPEDAALIVSIGTKSSKIAVNQFKDIPVLYTMVLNPVQEGIINPSLVSGRIIGGVTARVSADCYLKHAVSVQPETKKIGLLYSQSMKDYVALLQERAPYYNVELVSSQVSDKKDFYNRYIWVVKQGIDMYLILPDFNIYERESIEYVILNTFESGIPCFGPSPSYVKAGALCGFKLLPFEIGKQAGWMVESILKGESSGINYFECDKVLINSITAQKLGLEISDAVLQKAEIVGRGQ